MWAFVVLGIHSSIDAIVLTTFGGVGDLDKKASQIWYPLGYR